MVSFFCLLVLADPAARPLAHVLAPGVPVNDPSSGVTQEKDDVPVPEEGKRIEREISGGRTHSYKLALGPDQYARVLVEQKGIDVVVKLFAPDGSLITEVDDPNGTQGPEPVHITAEAPGLYRLEVSPYEPAARPGRYEVKLVELRAATRRDRERLTARRAADEGRRLREQATPDSLEAALKKEAAALALYRALEDRSEEFTTLLNLGNTYRLMGELQKALEDFDRSLQIARALGDQFRQGMSLEFTSLVYRDLGEWETALQSGEEALRLYQAAGARTKEVELLNYVGVLYGYLGEPERSREYYERVTRLSQVSGDKQSEARALHLLGYSYHLQGESQKALDYFVKALAAWQVVGNRRQEAIGHSAISNEYASAGQRQKALDHVEQALRLRQALAGDSNTEAVILNNVGVTYYKLGEFEKALGFYAEPLRLWQTLGKKRNEAITLRHVSAALRDQGRLSEARVNIEKSIALLEFIRDHAGSPESQTAFVASLFDYYEFYIDLLMRLHAADPQAGHDLAALAFTEKVKVRSLVELLAQARVDLRQGVDGALVERERGINERITARLDDLTRLRRDKDDALAATVEHEIDVLKEEQRQVRAEIRQRSPRYAALTEPQPLSVAEIRQRVVDAETLLLEYELGDERSYLWAVTPDGVRSYRLPPRAEVEAQARRVYQLLTARQAMPQLTPVRRRAREAAADAQFRAQAAILSEMLLGPVAAQLGTKRLLIVADGALQYLPFAALPAPATRKGENRPAPRPLILDHEIVSLPSASVLTVLRRELADRQPAARMVAVLADPVFGTDDARVKRGLASGQRPGGAQEQRPAAAPTSTLRRALRSVRGDDGGIALQRLLFSRDEAEAILSMTSRGSGLEALDFRASRKLAMSGELGQYRVVHFSTHGLLDSRRPELSGLVLSLVDEDGRPQDGFLRLHEIYNLRLNADLVVLSACQTGVGEEVKGEGLIGLTRGFMYAGAPRVVASLWQVDDAATAALMKRFYRGVLREQLPPAAALRAAQIELMKQGHWQSPYYWGAFVLQGEWR